MTNDLDRLKILAKRTLQEKAEREKKAQADSEANEIRKLARIEDLARRNRSGWIRAFKHNMPALSAKGFVELHYCRAYSLFGGVRTKWNSRAREYYAPDVDFDYLEWKSDREKYAQAVTSLLGPPFAVTHSEMSGHIPHRKGSEFHGYTDETYDGTFNMHLSKLSEDR